MKRIGNKICHMSALVILLAWFPLSGEWDEPVDIFTAKSTESPVVGIDASGNAVIVTTASDDQKTYYTQATQFVNGVCKNVHTFYPIGTKMFNTAISVNAKGNAALAWLEIDDLGNDYFVRSSMLIDNVWDSPTCISDPIKFAAECSRTPGVHLDASDKAIAAWTAENRAVFSYHIQYNRYKSAWLGEQDVYSTYRILTSAIVAGSPSGKALAAWCRFSGNFIIQAAYYDGNTWSVQDLSTDVFYTCLPLMSASMNSAENAILLWNNASTGGLSSISYINGQYGPEETIYVPASKVEISSAEIVLDDFGNATALWTIEDESTKQKAVMMNRHTKGQWGTPVVFDTADHAEILRSPHLAIDREGDALAIWEKGDAARNSAVYHNRYVQQENTWLATPERLSPPKISAKLPHLAMNASGDATVVWNRVEAGKQTVQAIQYKKLPAPQVVEEIPTPPPPLNKSPAPVENLSGKQIRIRFAFQTDIVNVLNWKASNDPSVVSYYVFRNDDHIAAIPATAPLMFEDHKRTPGQRIVYKVVAVNAIGAQSIPQSVTLQ